MTKKKPASTPTSDGSINELEQRIGELTEALQRERADAINLRERYETQLARVRKSTEASVVAELLPVIDNFERALKHVPKELEANDYIKGVRSVAKQFESTLHAMGVERIATVNEPFDPRYHEAVTADEGTGDQEIVSEEIRPGYKLGDTVIRHAQVRVSRR